MLGEGADVDCLSREQSTMKAADASGRRPDPLRSLTLIYDARVAAGITDSSLDGVKRRLRARVPCGSSPRPCREARRDLHPVSNEAVTDVRGRCLRPGRRQHRLQKGRWPERCR